MKNIYAGIMTTDIVSAHRWYSELLERDADHHPMESLYEWDFPDGGVLQLVQDKARGGHSSVTILVADIAVLSKRLKERGIEGDAQDASEVAKLLTIHDPENNRITFAQNLQGR